MRLVDKRNSYEKFLDRLFLSIVLLLPFERAFIDENGQGAFLQYFFILFFMLSLPVLKRYYRHWSIEIWLYFTFLLIATISDAFSMGFSLVNMPIFQFLSWEIRAWIVFYILLVTYNYSLRSESRFKSLVYCLLTFSVVVAIFQVIGIGAVAHGGERGVEGERIAVMGANLNGTARDVSLFILFAFLLFVDGIKLVWRKKIFILCMSLVSFAALLRTGSRGGTLALLAVMPLAVFTTKKFSKKILYVLAISMALAGMVLAVLNTPTLMDRLNKTIDSGDTGGREYIFYAAEYLISKQPYFGYGSVAYSYFLGPMYNVRKLRVASHCTYTSALLSAGWVGGSMYFLFLILVGWRAWKCRYLPYGNLLLLTFVMGILGGITMNIEYTKWYYLLYGSILGFYRQQKTKKSLRHVPPVRF